MIKEYRFMNAMEKRWTVTLGNVASPALRRTWAQIVQSFNKHIKDHHDPDRGLKWTVLQPATGTGKSQGTVVYCSLLAELIKEEQPGVLIVTRLITDAEKMANEINELVGNPFAIAHHSKSKTKIEELNEWDVVVVTHRAYELALDALGKNATIEGTWEYFYQMGSIWDQQTRKLVVIDEALDIVEHSQAGLAGLRQTLAAIPESLREKFPDQIRALKYVIDQLAELNGLSKDVSVSEYMLPDDQVQSMHKNIATTDFSELRKEMRNVRFDIQIRQNDKQSQRSLAEMHDARLRSLQHIFKSWLYYAKVYKNHTFNTARLLVPEESKGAVVLDATASSSVFYELFDKAEVMTPPAKARTYANVTCHFSRGHRLGKRHMSTNVNAKKMSRELIEDLNQRLRTKNVLVCTHKSVEPYLHRYEPDFVMRIAHWGAIDGSNEWNDCDAVVIFGLPYLPNTWTTNVYMATQGAVENSWFNGENRKYGRHKDVRNALKIGQMTVSLVQAINRVQCRKVIDEQGNCPATDVYLMLPNDALSDELIAGIRREMPNINMIEDWELEVAKRRVRKSDHSEALISYLKNMFPGKQAASHVRAALGVPKRTWIRLMGLLSEKTVNAETKKKQTKVDLIEELKKLGVRYERTGYGKGQRAYFVK